MYPFKLATYPLGVHVHQVGHPCSKVRQYNTFAFVSQSHYSFNYIQPGAPLSEKTCLVEITFPTEFKLRLKLASVSTKCTSQNSRQKTNILIHTVSECAWAKT